jgi:peptide deformylase
MENLMLSLSSPQKVENAKCREVGIKDFSNPGEFVDNARDMIKICIENNGIGLAAPQVGLDLRFFIAYDMKDKTWGLYLNPSYVSYSKETIESEEACLTYIGSKYKIERWPSIIAKWLILDIKEMMFIEKSQELSGLLSQVFQHETDHCDGKTIAMFGYKMQ